MRKFQWVAVQVMAQDSNNYRVKGLEGEGDIIVIIPGYVCAAAQYAQATSAGASPLTFMGMPITAFMPGFNQSNTATAAGTVQPPQPVIFNLPCNSDELNVGEVDVIFNGMRTLLLNTSFGVAWRKEGNTSDLPCLIFMKKTYLP